MEKSYLKIKTIKNIGKKHTYDITVKNNHNFIVNNIVVHNSANPLIKSIQPSRFEDIVAISSINRPGPSETFGPVYAKWKRYFKEGTPEKCAEDGNIFPKLDFMQEITKETYYCLIYQEQIMKFAVAAADFNLGEADSLRRVLGWREDHPKFHTVQKYFDKLESGMLKKGYSLDDVKYFLEYCRMFAGYSFNKSHACLVGETKLETKSSKKTIFDIQVGEEVLTYNETTKTNEFKKVKRVFIQGTKKTYKIKTKSGKILETTEDHLVYTEQGYKTIKECISQNLKIKIK